MFLWKVYKGGLVFTGEMDHVPRLREDVVLESDGNRTCGEIYRIVHVVPVAPRFAHMPNVPGYPVKEIYIK